MTSKFQPLLIFIISSFTTTPLAINCSSIICHSFSSIPIEGEYRPSLKDCLITSGSSSEASPFMSNKTLSAIAFVDPRPQPLTLVGCGAQRTSVFHRALVPHFLFIARGAGARGGASVLVG
jgi:hypothetical protein